MTSPIGTIARLAGPASKVEQFPTTQPSERPPSVEHGLSQTLGGLKEIALALNPFNLAGEREKLGRATPSLESKHAADFTPGDPSSIQADPIRVPAKASTTQPSTTQTSQLNRKLSPITNPPLNGLADFVAGDPSSIQADPKGDPA